MKPRRLRPQWGGLNAAKVRRAQIRQFVRFQATLEHTDTVVTCHDPAHCTGRPCTLHNRSDHSMRSFPQHWRADRGIIERICPHRIGHPDPDSPWPAGSAEWVHGCDGCCSDECEPYVCTP